METVKRERIDFAHLRVGDAIVYVLRSDQYPTIPLRPWRGRVKQIDLVNEIVLVEVLDEGFEGEEEPVYLEQIVGREPGRGE